MSNKLLTSLIILLWLSPNFISAQINLNQYANFISNPLYNDSAYKSTFLINWDAGFGSNSITNSLFTNYLFNNRIDATAVENSINQNKDENRIAISHNYSIAYYHNKNWFKNFKPYISINKNLVTSALFSEQVLPFVYYGNAPFANQKINLGNTSFEHLSYYSINLGINSSFKIKNTVVSSFFNIKVLAGESFQKFDLDKAIIFTEEYGEFIDADIDFNYQLNDEGIFNAGYGLGIDWKVNFKLKNNSGIQLFVKDLGAIKWSEDTEEYSASKQLRLEGTYIKYEDLDNIDKKQFEGEFDIRKRINPDSSKQAITSYLPSNFGFKYFKKLNNKDMINVELDSYLSQGFSPRFNLQWYHFLTNMYYAPSISYGGYSSISLNIAAGVSMKNFSLQMNLGNIQSSFINKTPGLNAALQLGYLID